MKSGTIYMLLGFIMGQLLVIVLYLKEILDSVLEIAATHKALLDYFHRVLN